MVKQDTGRFHADFVLSQRTELDIFGCLARFRAFLDPLLVQLLAQPLGELGQIGRLHQLVELLLVLADLEVQMPGEILQQRQRLGCLGFGQQPNLQVEVGAVIGFAAHSVLVDQYEDRQQHALGRDDQGENPERKGIEHRQPRNPGRVPHEPHHEDHQVGDHERQAAHHADQVVADTFGGGTATGLVALQRGDRADIVLGHLGKWMVRLGWRRGS